MHKNLQEYPDIMQSLKNKQLLQQPFFNNIVASVANNHLVSTLQKNQNT